MTRRRTSTTEQVQAAYLEAAAAWDSIPAQHDFEESIPEMKEIVREDNDLRTRWKASMQRLDQLEDMVQEFLSPLLARSK